MAEGVELVIVQQSLLSHVEELIAKVDDNLRHSDSLYRAEFDVVDDSPNWIKVEVKVT